MPPPPPKKFKATPKTRKRTVWSEEENRAFIGILIENNINGMLDKKRFRTSDVVKIVHQEMELQGYCKTLAQIMNKYKNLKDEFETFKAANKRSGNSPAPAAEYHEMAEIFEHRPRQSLKLHGRESLVRSPSVDEEDEEEIIEYLEFDDSDHLDHEEEDEDQAPAPSSQLQQAPINNPYLGYDGSAPGPSGGSGSSSHTQAWDGIVAADRVQPTEGPIDILPRPPRRPLDGWEEAEGEAEAGTSKKKREKKSVVAVLQDSITTIIAAQRDMQRRDMEATERRQEQDQQFFKELFLALLRPNQD